MKTLLKITLLAGFMGFAVVACKPKEEAAVETPATEEVAAPVEAAPVEEVAADSTAAAPAEEAAAQ
jgi:hypothetical protein